MYVHQTATSFHSSTSQHPCPQSFDVPVCWTWVNQEGPGIQIHTQIYLNHWLLMGSNTFRVGNPQIQHPNCILESQRNLPARGSNSPELFLHEPKGHIRKRENKSVCQLGSAFLEDTPLSWWFKKISRGNHPFCCGPPICHQYT